MLRKERHAHIIDVASRVPRGRVATYGQIASLAGLPRHARHVGFALRDLPDDSDVPWHRILGARGEISRRSSSDTHELQRLLLEAEGIRFDDRGRVNLEKFRWEPDDRPGGAFLNRPER
ncbi:MAG: MGMT family protein [Acidobacteria bacterium]|nr:MGMT family protein [Acidobacteriota bacterium]